MRIGIRVKLSLAAFGLTLVAASAVGLVVYRGLSSVLVRFEVERLDDYLHVGATEASLRLEVLRQDALLLSNTPPIQGIIRARMGGGLDPLDGSSESVWLDRLATIFAELLEAKPDYESVRYVSVEGGGREVARVERRERLVVRAPVEDLAASGYDQPFTTAFASPSRDVRIAMPHELEGHGSEDALHALVPVHAEDASRFGFVMVSMDLDAMIQAATSSYPPYVSEYITDDGGTLLSHLESENPAAETASAPPRMQDLHPELADVFEVGNRMPSTALRTGEGGRVREIRFMKVAFDPLRPERFIGLGLGAFEADLVAESKAVRDRSVVLAVTLILGATLLAYLLSRSMTRPLERMSLSARRIAAGDRDVPLPLGAGDEIGVLARAFHTMVERLGERTESLGRSEANYRSIVENAVHGICRMRADGRFLSVNRALVAMLGYGSHSALLEARADRDIWGDPAAWQRLMARLDRSGSVEEMDAEWKRLDGSSITVRINGRVVREAGGPESFEVLVEDISQRVLLEEQLRQAQKMEAVGQLAGGVAHDFNNLLSVILTGAALAAEDLPPGSDSSLARLGEIEAAANRGADLVRSLLGYGRRQPLDPSILDLRDTVRETARVLRSFLPESITIRTSADDGTEKVVADPGVVQQILLNLAANARDAMPDGGELHIHTRAIRVTDRTGLAGAEPGRYVTVATRDTGMGMSEETLPRVFEPFFTTKEAGKGTGLGMSMVYGLVKQHAGHVHVKSAPGSGTTVTLLFPVTELEGPHRPSRQQRLPGDELPTGVETILLVEDQVEVRHAAVRVLERHGYRLLVAPDGAEALSLLRKREAEVDLVVSDIVMPNMSGPQLREALRKEGIHVRFLFTSGYTERGVDAEADMDGYFPFLGKPWSVPSLLWAVREALDTPPAEPGSR